MDERDPVESVAASSRRRFGRVVLEAVSVIFAVLVALAVDEWWEERELEALADRTLDAIAEEMRTNRAALQRSDAQVDLGGALRNLDAAIAAFRAGKTPEGSVGANWDVSLLSSAAWESATITGAAPYIELAQLIDLAQIYELQRYFRGIQEQLSADISNLNARMLTQPLPALVSFRFRFAAAAETRRTLATTYACALVRLDAATGEEAAACPTDTVVADEG